MHSRWHRKIVDLRIFRRRYRQKETVRCWKQTGALLVVSQFTLLGDCRKGRRPSFIEAGAAGRGGAAVSSVYRGRKKIRRTSRDGKIPNAHGCIAGQRWTGDDTARQQKSFLKRPRETPDSYNQRRELSAGIQPLMFAVGRRGTGGSGGSRIL